MSFFSTDFTRSSEIPDTPLTARDITMDYKSRHQRTDTRVYDPSPDAPLEKTGTPVAAVHAVVFSERFVAAHPTVNWNRKGPTCKYISTANIQIVQWIK